MSTATIEPVKTSLVTAEIYSGMSFDVPVELVRGEIIEMTNPGARHGIVCSRIAFQLGKWAESQQSWLICTNDSGVLIQHNPDTVRGPGVLVIHQEKLPGGVIPKGHLAVAPEVTIEVVSPSDRWDNILEKVSQFLHVGVGEVWVIDPEHRRLHLFKRDDEPTIFNEDQTFKSTLLTGFEIPVKELFSGL
ncbi:MAG TPA: Uma2 family endonuclease [Planctomicrobium sp.]|nr:Uma2 family endonuclease [Planctomicrobium sp.]